MTPPRRFPPPWTYEDNGHCWVARDASGKALANFPYDERVVGMQMLGLTREEARKLAANFCKLPGLLIGPRIEPPGE